MAAKERQTVTPYDLKEIVGEHADHTVEAYFQTDFAVVKRMNTTLLRHLVDTPISFNEIRLIVVRKGTASVRINLLPYEINSGDFVFVSEGSTVEIASFSDSLQGTGILFTKEILHIAMNGHLPESFDGRLRDFKIRLSAEEQTLAEQIIAMIYDQINQPGHNHKVTASLLASLAWHIDGIRHRNAVSRQESQNRKQKLFIDFLQLVDRYVATERNLDFYAQRLCLSVRYMSTIIKEVSGQGAKEWIDRSLITAVKIDLKYTDKQIAQISFEKGFPNVSFFCKYFKRLTGQTPTEYRNM